MAVHDHARPDGNAGDPVCRQLDAHAAEQEITHRVIFGAGELARICAHRLTSAAAAALSASKAFPPACVPDGGRDIRCASECVQIRGLIGAGNQVQSTGDGVLQQQIDHF
jgi:hypothetical protein